MFIGKEGLSCHYLNEDGPDYSVVARVSTSDILDSLKGKKWSLPSEKSEVARASTEVKFKLYKVTKSQAKAKN